MVYTHVTVLLRRLLLKFATGRKHRRPPTCNNEPNVKSLALVGENRKEERILVLGQQISRFVKNSTCSVIVNRKVAILTSERGIVCCVVSVICLNSVSSGPKFGSIKKKID